MVRKQIKKKPKLNKELKEIIEKLLKDKKHLRRISLCISGILKLNKDEMKAFLDHNKLTEDNTRWAAFREVFWRFYDELKKKKSLCLNDIRKIEREVRRKYGYWKPKKKIGK